tara:strand:+ start:2455 stop:2817 length:363 start_codon:yes stop_codon:yes gene_type:complete
MAVPNIVNVATINGKVVTGALDTTTTTALLTCASDHVYKINTILISNIDGSSAADVTMTVRSDGSNDRHIAKTISVPADSTLALISKDTGFYLEEADVIKGGASANGDLEYLISYEDLVD